MADYYQDQDEMRREMGPDDDQPRKRVRQTTSQPMWRTREGKLLRISSMETTHIQNCIKMLTRKMPDLPDEDDYLTADHWSLEGAVLFVPGKPYAREKIGEFKAELKKRGVLK